MKQDKKSKAKKFKATFNSLLQKDAEFEDAAISASEDEGDDTRSHQKLLAAVRKLKGQKPTVTQRSEASQDISEFNLTEVGKEKVKLNELIKTLKQTTKHVSIKHQLQKVSKKKKLSVPLSKSQNDKIKRGVAYDKVTEEVGKWDRVVQINRSAEQIIFPLRQPEFRLETAENFAKRFTTKTPLEEEVAKLLRGSEHVLDQEKEFTPAEEKALKAMSKEEAEMRHKELQQMRALLSYKEAKARRQSKIKSKKYHRILKKEKMKKLVKDFEELQKSDPEAAKEKFKELDKQRILERMTLKHKSTGKWAKYQKLRAKYNPESRDSLKQQLELGRTLVEKVTEPDALEETAGNVADLAKEEKQNYYDDALLKLYASSDIGNNCADIRQTLDKEREPDMNVNIPKETQPEVNLEGNDLDDIESAHEDVDLIDESLERKQDYEDFEDLLEDVAEHDSKELTQGSSKKENVPKKKKPVKPKRSLAEAEFTCLDKVLDAIVPNEITCGEEGIDDISENVMNIQQAFADEDVISEFKLQKQEVRKQEQPEGIDLFLPGWGSWGGPGIKPSRRKKKRFFIKAPVLSRRDDTLGNVIINEEKDKKASMHQVTELPFPYKSIQQFQSIIRQPVGSTWNPETSFRNMIAPKVITKAGKIIDPIDADAVVLQKKVDQHPRKLGQGKSGKLSLNPTQSKHSQKKNKVKPKFKKQNKSN